MQIMRKHVGWAVGAVALGALGGCTTAELEAISAGLSAGMADAAYTSSQYGYGTQPAYGGRYWSPNTFGSYGGWPANYSYGDWVGYNQCRKLRALSWGCTPPIPTSPNPTSAYLLQIPLKL